MPLSYKNDNDTDERLNPSSNTARDLYDREFNDIANNFDETADPSQEDANIKKADRNDDPNENRDSIKDKEESAGNWTNNVSGNNQKKASFFGRLQNNKKKLAFIVIGGTSLAGIVFSLFLMIMPLKLEMFIQNSTKHAARVPAYAVEQRTEYLITSALATRMMMLANGADAEKGKLAFCGNGSISCSLFLTYTSDYFEKKMDLSFEKRTDGKVHLSIEGKGRNSLGGKAHSWDIEVSRDMGSGGVLKTVRQIELNSEMKSYIKKRVKNDMKSSNTISRFLARRILMKKYGVSHWRGFEKTQKKYADIKSSVKASIFKNTIGKIAPRTSMYMACLAGGDGCAKLLESAKSNIDLDKIKADNGGDENSPAYKAAVKQQATIDRLQGQLSGVPTEADNSIMSKFISKRLLTSVAAGAGAIGVADLLFTGVSQIDKGALEEIGYDIMKTAMIGYAFGDESGVVVNNDKMKASEVGKEIDIETFGVITSMFDGAEKSPLYAAETGLPGVAAGSQVTRECDTAEGLKPVTLEPGQLLCPERRLVRDYTSSFTQNPMWVSLSVVAAAWMSSVHVAVEALGELSAAALRIIPGMEQAMAAIGSRFTEGFQWLASLIVDVPTMGFETTGANNLDMLSGGVRVAQNELMQQGVGTDGKAFGGGGTVLATDQIAMIQQQDMLYDKEFYNNQPILAKIFDASLTGSFAQHFVASMPTSAGGLLQTPSLALASLTTANSASAISPMAANPFNMPIYGYAANDPALTADPSTYTAEKCATLAKAREDSFAKHPGSLVATYSVSDPCALEKMVVGAALEDAGVRDDPNSMPTLDSLNTATAADAGSSSTGDGQSTGEFLWPLKAPDSAQNVSRCYIPGTYKTGHLAIDIGTFTSSLEVIAADGGEVVWTHHVEDRAYESFGNAITIKHKDGLFTTYSHNAKLFVNKGDKVTKGQKIAESGSTGNSQSPHLHFEVSKQASPYWPDTTNTMDPLNYFTIPAGISIPSGLGCRR